MVEKKKGAGSVLGASGAKADEVARKESQLGTVNTKGPSGSSTIITNPDGSRTEKTKLSKSEEALRKQGNKIQKQSLRGASDILKNFRQDYRKGFDVTKGVGDIQKGDYSNIGNWGNIDPNKYGDFRGEQSSDVLGRAGQIGNLDFSGREWAGQNFDDILGKANQYSDQTYNRIVQGLQPEFQRQQQGLTESMINRGIATGSNPFQRSVQSLSEQQNRSLLDARNMADQQGQNLAVQGGTLASNNLNNYATNIALGARTNQTGADLMLKGAYNDFDMYNKGQQTNLDAQKTFYDNLIASDDLRLRGGQQAFKENYDVADFKTKANLTNFKEPVGAVSVLGGVATGTKPETTPNSATFTPPNYGSTVVGFEGIAQSGRNNATQAPVYVSDEEIYGDQPPADGSGGTTPPAGSQGGTTTQQGQTTNPPPQQKSSVGTYNPYPARR